MSWENELKEDIKLTSPEGNVFYGLWRANDRSGEKKLGIFSIPKFQGDIVQDMDVKSTIYPLNIFFDGLYHHRTADDFDRALKENGQWEIIHPVKGPLILQLMSWREIIDPITAGNYTEFETQWIEPANVQRLISPTELASSIISTIIALKEDAAAVLQQLRADTYGLIQASINAFNSAAGILDKTMAELTATDVIVFDAYETARTALTSAINNYEIGSTETDDISDNMTEMALVPTEASEDFTTRYSAYESLSEGLIELIPDNSTEEDFNKVVCQEYSTTLSLLAIAQITATSVFASRTEVVSAMENIIDIFNNTVTAIENAQDNFSDLDIDLQYFSQTRTYTQLINLYTLTLRYLITQFYNLAVEKRITLQKPTSPLALTVTEYGELGENDFNYDLLIASNRLTKNEILWLPTGKEIVIYV